MIKSRAIFPVCILIFTLSGGCNKGTNPTSAPGPKWVQFNTSNSSLLSDHVNALFVDAEGTLWCGTDSGASGYNKGTWSNLRSHLGYQISGGSFAYDVTSISSSGDGSLWFGMRGGGVVRYAKNSPTQVWTTYNSPGANVPFNTISGVAGELVQQKETWIVTSNLGASRYTPDVIYPNDPTLGRWTAYNNGNSVLPNQLWSVALNTIDDNVWFGTQANGVIAYDMDVTWRQFPLPDSVAYKVLGMTFDAGADGSTSFAWLAKLDRGVSVLNVKTTEWVHHYTAYNTNGMIPQGPIYGIAGDHHNTHWFGTVSGLVQLKDTVWTAFNNSTVPQMPDDAVTALYYDDNRNNLWIGTNESGLVVYNPNGTDLQ